MVFWVLGSRLGKGKKPWLSGRWYHQAIREMRFLLESWLQAYYIDREYPKNTKEEKIKLLEENERQEDGRWYGSHLFSIALTGKLKKKVKYLYFGKLSKFVHSSSEELKRIEGKYSFSETGLIYRPELFKKKF